ncbi:glycosyltransferase family 2 protein [Hyalangium gracile]|uniref:glycosyltransferase family 2 protein n=1 Tax=Hyalangium gracile TaxID=394092 RepID=UPI001CCBBF36|nr:cellulose synthase catalytic subunit [Hyalangium gracile]
MTIATVRQPSLESDSAPPREEVRSGSIEERQPPEPMPHSAAREALFQSLATASVVFGLWYLDWRWTSSVNWEAWWFSVPLLLAETLAFVGTCLFMLNLWRTEDTPRSPPPATVADILERKPKQDRPLIVDVFVATYSEDPELVRLSLRDARKLRYPHPIDLRVHALDDGRRPAMRAVAEQEGVGYITRGDNVGFKAGNIRNALEQTQGDLVVICDADTRPFPELLEETLGYFRDPRVAWVQTPQWFYDLDEGTPLPDLLSRSLRLGRVGRALGRGVEALIGPVRVGADLFGNDPALFYDVIQRRRNWCNASFCCGAGSVHRRDAVMEAALRAYGEQVASAVEQITQEVKDTRLRADLSEVMSGEAAREFELTPYKFHVSEDIYTSIVLHSDCQRRWKSVYHPRVLTRMLSPQDLLAWTIQRFKYAGGTLDIFWNDNPLRRAGLSIWQKLMYGTTIYSYLAPLWTVVFLLWPILYLFTGLSPVEAYDTDFYMHLVPFVVLNKVAFAVGTWGVPAWRGEQYYLSFFWLNIKAIADVMRGRPIKFHVTPKTRQAGTFLSLVWPHVALIALTLLGLVVMGVRVFVLRTEGLDAYLANAFWGLNNVLALSAIVFAALRKEKGN